MKIQFQEPRQETSTARSGRIIEKNGIQISERRFLYKNECISETIDRKVTSRPLRPTVNHDPL